MDVLCSNGDKWMFYAAMVTNILTLSPRILSVIVDLNIATSMVMNCQGHRQVAIVFQAEGLNHAYAAGEKKTLETA